MKNKTKQHLDITSLLKVFTLPPYYTKWHFNICVVLHFIWLLTVINSHRQFNSHGKTQTIHLCLLHLHAYCTNLAYISATYRRLLSVRPYSQPLRGSWTSTVIVSPLLKGRSFGLEEEGWDTRALMALPEPRPRDSPTELERERLGRGDGAGVGEASIGRTQHVKHKQIYTMPIIPLSVGCNYINLSKVQPFSHLLRALCPVTAVPSLPRTYLHL